MTAALAGVSQLPPVLKVRPVGAVAATVADHPGMEVLEQAGVCLGGALDGDVAEWILTLGRPDIEVDVVVTRPQTDPTTPAGPVTPFEAPQDAIEAADALARWNATWAPQRALALCRRDNSWIAAARLWHTGAEGLDEVVVSALGPVSPPEVVCAVLGNVAPAQFHGINVEAAVIEPVINDWLAGRGSDIVAMLTAIGLSVPQALIVEAIGDATTTRAVLTAAQFSLDGPQWAALGISVADTRLGRVVITNALGPDGRQWTTVLPGSDAAVAGAVTELLDSLPTTTGWMTHQRSTSVGAHPM
ncbi:ESX secretion-associated protein EspG [Mycobacterium simiae]|uniref:ESX secretion-associated protein EspG n=1 Tax=Mycobacterium simiae TaxID=1784 RepID=UPI00262E50EF|nr:ESX secretion-associated protein EspG [Mycobacterium simiae]